MSLEISTITIAQLFSIAIALPAILLSYSRGKAEGRVALTLSSTVAICGYIFLPSYLSELYKSSTIIHFITNSLFGLSPSLFSDWYEASSWICFLASSMTAWLYLYVRIRTEPANNIVRGSRLICKREFRSLIEKTKLSKLPVWVGNVPIPTELETRALLICGEPGTGKTLIILRMILSVIDRGESFVCVDVAGDLYKRLGCENDVVLSPLHENGIDTSPFADIRIKSDCRLMADSYIPLGVGDSQTWNLYARSLLTVILEKCIERKTTRNRDLIHLSAYAGKAELSELVRGTTAQRLFESSNEKKIDDILSIVSEALKPLELLNPDADHTSFSVRDWVTNDNKQQNLWIIFEDSTDATLVTLRRSWISLIVTEFLSVEPSASRRTWIFLDELASHGKVADFSKAVSRLRKYGACLVFAYQNIHQIYSLYGQDESKRSYCQIWCMPIRQRY